MRSVAVACLLAAPAFAQQEVMAGTGAVLRALDKVNGDVTDITIAPGEQAGFGRLVVRMAQCRYPAGNPAGDAFAFLTMRDIDADEDMFSGWMVASSPALNGLDHPRYDVWVMRCKTE
ncbi:DUF2155 domain-containing protein [Roseovarius sp. LXJ103]|uniref:DUF2155 domain-containing protein n=1 Tax=Roseovarius carneus TaxID=2853164 RepID=UPI000D612F7D|nr:DUF2155 domain-containing protein [Roseovarius carneus]PWE37252.1 DUF2155 domain-containing protein [Pelagicola sp. LXJ1103]